MTIPLDGPRRPPASGKPPTSLVVLLHGYGASGDDLIESVPCLPNGCLVLLSPRRTRAK